MNGKSVCDDYWEKIVGPKNAIFVCRFDLTSVSKQHMLLQDVGPGYSAGKFTMNSEFGNVPSDFSLDDVKCTGTERSILACPHSTTENCGASEGAGVGVGGTAFFKK